MFPKLFCNSVPLCIGINEKKSFRAVVAEIEEVFSLCNRHQDIPAHFFANKFFGDQWQSSFPAIRIFDERGYPSYHSLDPIHVAAPHDFPEDGIKLIEV